MSKVIASFKGAVLFLLFTAMIAAEVFAQDASSCKSLVGENPELPFVVVGRVVDSEGRPVVGSDVSLDPRGSTEMLNPYESAITDENGCFKFVGFGHRKALHAEWFLYTTDNFVSPGIAPITPPFVGYLQKLDSVYSGIPFVPGNRRVIDMGDVPVIFRYGSARLRFVDCTENKCSSAIQWGMAMTSLVHCGSGKWVSQSTHSREQLERYVYDQDEDLIYLLPEGRWKIEIYNHDEKKPAAATQCFEVEINKIIDVSTKLIDTGQADK